MTAAEPEPDAPLTWRPGVVVLLVAGSLLLAASVVTRSPVPLFVALPLLLAPAASALSAPAGTCRARLVWEASGTTGEVTIRGRIAPTAGVRVAELDVTFYRPGPLQEGHPPTLRRSAEGVEFTLERSTPPPCIITIPRPDVFWRDPLGLLERRVTVEGEALRVERFPPEAGRLGPVRLRRTTMVPGEIRSRALGPSGEFFAIRTATPTDTPRQINWRASARMGRLLANEYLLERTGDLLLLLDLRPTSLGPRHDRTLLAISRAAAMGLASGFLADKSRVGVGLFGEFLTAVPMGTGRLQRYRIFQALQRATLTDQPGPSERFAVSLRRYFPPGATTVLLSSLADESSVLLLTHLRRRGYPTIVLSPSPLPLLVPNDESRSGDDALAARLISLVRRLRVSQVWREAPVVDWTDYWSLTPFVRFLTQPARNPRGA